MVALVTPEAVTIEIDALVTRGQAALAEYASFDQETIDFIVKKARQAVAYSRTKQ